MLRSFIDTSHEHHSDFTDHLYQQNLNYFERSHTSKSLKNNLKSTELLTDPSHAYLSKRVCIRLFVVFFFFFFQICLEKGKITKQLSI